MKSKGEKIALAVAIFIIILYIVGTISALVFGFKFVKENVMLVKDSITPEKFVSIMKEEGFEVKEISAHADGVESKKGYKAENGKYIIEFYEFENEIDSNLFFLEKQQDMDSKTSTKKISMSGENYSTFTLVRNGIYTFIERIDKTVIIVNGTSKQENSSKELLKSFGY